MGYCETCNVDIEVESHESSGFTCCPKCGSVLEESVLCGRVTFSKGSHGKSVASSSFVSDLGPERQNVGRLSSTRQRVFLSSGSSSELLEKKNKGFVVEIADRLGIRISKGLVDSACSLLRSIATRKLGTGKRKQLLAACCIYSICSQDNRPYMLIDFADKLDENVYDMAYTLARTRQVLGNDLFSQNRDPSIFLYLLINVDKCASKLQSVSITALRLIASLERSWWSAKDSRAPVFASAIQLSSSIHNITQSELDILAGMKNERGACQPSIDSWSKYADTLANTVQFDEIQRKSNEKESNENRSLKKFHKEYSAMDEIQQMYAPNLFQTIEAALINKKVAVPHKTASNKRKRPISSVAEGVASHRKSTGESGGTERVSSKQLKTSPAGEALQRPKEIVPASSTKPKAAVAEDRVQKGKQETTVTASLTLQVSEAKGPAQQPEDVALANSAQYSDSTAKPTPNEPNEIASTIVAAPEENSSQRPELLASEECEDSQCEEPIDSGGQSLVSEEKGVTEKSMEETCANSVRSQEVSAEAPVEKAFTKLRGSEDSPTQPIEEALQTSPDCTRPQESGSSGSESSLKTGEARMVAGKQSTAAGCQLWNRYLNNEYEVQMKKKVWNMLYADYFRKEQRRVIKRQPTPKTTTQSPDSPTGAEPQVQSSNENDTKSTEQAQDNVARNISPNINYTAMQSFLGNEGNTSASNNSEKSGQNKSSKFSFLKEQESLLGVARKGSLLTRFSIGDRSWK